ncbi:hypothetical protein L1049_004841 [Liquidambar formosana]|uniref:Uncharacterized protein n=1 Tax=Liquidambar formosana TaxID=63359 RepID=A0AAP0X119_LIQFO
MAKRRVILPQECWELIFNRVDGLEAISLVCKEFLSISNSVRHSLRVYNLTVLCRLLKRFPHLKKIDLSVFDGDIDLAILEIARSGLNLEALNVSNQKILPVESLRVLGSYMKSLKTLECGNLDLLRDSDLQAISDSFPWLEELDISSPSASEQLVTDDGIEVLASKLRALSKINVSWNTNLSDRSILALSSNSISWSIWIPFKQGGDSSHILFRAVTLWLTIGFLLCAASWLGHGQELVLWECRIQTTFIIALGLDSISDLALQPWVQGHCWHEL